MLSTGNQFCRVISVYRPPPSVKNKLPFSQFLEAFSDLMERIIPSSTKVILAGDFNIHFDLQSDTQSSLLLMLLLHLIYTNTLLVLPIAQAILWIS